MALPSIVLLVVFAGSIFAAGNHLLIEQKVGYLPSLLESIGWTNDRPGMIALTALMTCAVVAVHYIRFRIPITIAAGTAALAVTVLALLVAVAPDLTKANIRIIILILGLAIFALAMRFDLSDPQRVTRRNDIAFWLHLLAAPLIVHSVISGLAVNDASSPVWTAGSVLVIFMALGAVAVAIDRRAMLVSGLAYAGYAFSSLIREVGFEGDTVPATLLTLGAFVLLLSAGWRPVRTALLRLLPTHLAQRLPHPILSGS
jgi:hypothetical protein